MKEPLYSNPKSISSNIIAMQRKLEEESTHSYRVQDHMNKTCLVDLSPQLLNPIRRNMVSPPGEHQGSPLATRPLA